MPAAHFLVKGKVQGVGFRYWASRHAERLGLRGWIRNEWDGSVRGEVAGSAEALEEFRKLLGIGPKAARVSHVEWEPCEEEPQTEGFEIRG
jgi:acylphosphatase